MAKTLDPLYQFNIGDGLPIEIAGLDLSLTKSAIFMLVAVGLTAVVMTAGMRRRAMVPGRLQAMAELLYGFIANLIRDNVGSEGRKYFPFVFSIFMIVLLGNLLGMLPLLDWSFTYTSHIIVTFTLAMIVFLSVTVIAFARHGLHFFSFFMPHGAPLWLAPLLIPIEVISYLTRPVSLAIRLFANMMAGHTMMYVFGGFTVMLAGAFGAGGYLLGLAPVAVNFALVGFEILVALLQAYVFTILTCLYLKDAIELH